MQKRVIAAAKLLICLKVRSHRRISLQKEDLWSASLVTCIPCRKSGMVIKAGDGISLPINGHVNHGSHAFSHPFSTTEYFSCNWNHNSQGNRTWLILCILICCEWSFTYFLILPLIAVVSRGPLWIWNPDLLDRCAHLFQENCSLLCACVLFTLSPFPAICSASLSWKSGRVGATCASCPAASALQTSSCLWSRVGTLFSRKAAVAAFPITAQPLQNILECCHLDSIVSPHCIWRNQN